VKQTGPVHFSHTKHLKSMQCNACHDALYAAGSNKQVSMAEMEKGKSCGTCHDDTAAFGVKENCEKCHTQVQAKKGGSQ
jgi:c(7)-type cytochrome triheme protein